MSKNEGNQKLKFFKPSDLAWNAPGRLNIPTILCHLVRTLVGRYILFSKESQWDLENSIPYLYVRTKRRKFGGRVVTELNFPHV